MLLTEEFLSKLHSITISLELKFLIQSEKEEKEAQIHKQLVVIICEYIRRLEEEGYPVSLMAV